MDTQNLDLTLEMFFLKMHLKRQLGWRHFRDQKRNKGRIELCFEFFFGLSSATCVKFMTDGMLPRELLTNSILSRELRQP